MATPQFAAAIAALNALTAEELNDLVPHWKLIAKNKRSGAAQAKVQSAGGFAYGDILRWTSTKRGRPDHQYMKFEKYNRAGHSAVGMECDKDGKVLAPQPGKSGKWTVSITFIDQVNGKTITK